MSTNVGIFSIKANFLRKKQIKLILVQPLSRKITLFF